MLKELHKTVPEVFHAQVERTPHAVAVRYNGREYTYEVLNRHANQLAHCLQSRGVQAESFVGILMEPSPEAVTAILGILKAGNVFVVFDLHAPPQRLLEMIEDSRLRFVITTAELRVRLPESLVETICVDEDRASIAAESPESPVFEARLHGTGYVVYTSGSTGKPKGVLLSDRSILNGLSALPFHPDLPDEVCALNSPLSSLFSMARLFLPLLSGVPLAIVSREEAAAPESLVCAWEAEKVTVGSMVTPMFREIINAGRRLTTRLRRIRTLMVGGATLTPDLVSAFRSALPQARLINDYGATEVGGPAMMWTVTEAMATGTSSEPVFTGHPFANTQVYILDENQIPLPDGITGELYVGAEHLSLGYLNRPDLTAERFFSDPFNHRPNSRMYSMGDLARRLPDGRLQLLGRADDQVKVRGFRVELGEVEGVLQQYGQVLEVAVIARDLESDPKLTAYVVPTKSVPGLVTDLKQYAHKHLPDYMVPARFILVTGLPRTHTGKVDRKSLPPPESMRPDLDVEYEAPGDAIETVIAAIWAEVLKLDRVGINDDFLELGGDSLQAARVVSRIRERLHLDLQPQVLLEWSTINALTSEIGKTSFKLSGFHAEETT